MGDTGSETASTCPIIPKFERETSLSSSVYHWTGHRIDSISIYTICASIGQGGKFFFFSVWNCSSVSKIQLHAHIVNLREYPLGVNSAHSFFQK